MLSYRRFKWLQTQRQEVRLRLPSLPHRQQPSRSHTDVEVMKKEIEHLKQEIKELKGR